MMKNKVKNMLITLLLFFAIVIISMCGTDLLLDLCMERIKGQSLMYSNDESGIDWLTSETSGSGIQIENTRMSIQQVSEIIQNKKLADTTIIHDPVEGQISLDAAIQKAKDWMSAILCTLAMEDDNENFDVQLAILSLPTTKKVNMPVSTEYSFWQVNLIGRNVSAHLEINAVTGNVWFAQLYFEGMEIENRVIDVIQKYIEKTEISDYANSAIEMEADGREWTVDLGGSITAKAVLVNLLNVAKTGTSVEMQILENQNITYFEVDSAGNNGTMLILELH